RHTRSKRDWSSDVCSSDLIWVECYFWSFPYYLVGAGFAGMIGWFNREFGWETSLLIVPIIYLIYRSYRLYLGKLEDEKRHVEERSEERRVGKECRCRRGRR